ncbi:MAG: hypothetical protein PHW95_04150 [Patescibacteria group bacterium]|nr:hypothetical protein [Patescibacteria group bacterium]
MLTYLQIFKQALKVASEKPMLLFFGFFVVLFGGSTEIGFLLSTYGFSGEQMITSFVNGLAEGGFFSIAGLKGLAAILSTNPLRFVEIFGVTLMIIVFIILAVVLMVISQSALVSLSVESSRGRQVRWGEGIGIGLIKFWPVLGFNLILRLATSAMLAVISIMALLSFRGIGLAITLTFYALTVIIMLISFFVKYSICGVVTKHWKFGEALANGWKLFRANWLATIEIAVILFVVYLLISLYLFFILALLLLFSIKFFAGFIFGVYLIIGLVLALFMVVQMYLAVFYWATWALVFEVITSKKNLLQSFIRRVMGRLKG